MYKSQIILAILCMLALSVEAQKQHRIGFLPQINLTYKIDPLWKINAKLESRQILLEGIDGSGTTFDFYYQRSDLTLMGAYKTGLRSSIGVGYMLRLTSENTVAHRFIQQYSIVKQLRILRLGHRLRTDQTFRSPVSTEFRFRYRLSLEFPLNGHEIDPREFYIKANSELLISNLDEVDLEIRGVGLVGFEFNPRNRLETGIDYRVNQFIIEFSRQNVWWLLGWYYRI